MSDIEKQIAERVDAFVADLSDLLRKAALQQAADILSEQAGGVSIRRSRRAARRSARRGRNGRRNPKQIDALTKRLLADVQSKPGRRVEEIGRDLGVGTRDLNLPIKRLLKSKQITRKGQRRATRYHPKTTSKRKAK